MHGLRNRSASALEDERKNKLVEKARKDSGKVYG